MLGWMASRIDEHKTSAGRRLRHTRLALDFATIRKFAEATGVPETNLGKWEAGEALVPTWYVERLRLTFKVSHDWIYGGEPGALPHTLAVEVVRVSNNNHLDSN